MGKEGKDLKLRRTGLLSTTIAADFRERKAKHCSSALLQEYIKHQGRLSKQVVWDMLMDLGRL